MPHLKNMVEKIRSKNAGPFWITIDVFCHSDGSFDTIGAALSAARVAALYGVAEDGIQRFDLRDLDVIKLSFPRPNVQGTRADRDMHGASFAHILEEMIVEQP